MSSQPKSRKLPKGSQDPSDLGKEYANWLTLVPKEERTALADTLQEHPVRTYDDLIGFSQAILVRVLEGRITPSVAHEARGWAELMMCAIAAKSSAMGTPGNAYTDLLAALEEVSEAVPLIEASYTDIEHPVVESTYSYDAAGELAKAVVAANED